MPPKDSKTLEKQGGGKVIYGRIAANDSLIDGIVATLRQVHAHFGEQPKIESLLKSRDSDTLGAFFTVDATNDGNKPTAGLVVITAAPGTSPEFAVLFDNADRFPFYGARAASIACRKRQFSRDKPFD